jgi:hypothetical protein
MYDAATKVRPEKGDQGAGKRKLSHRELNLLEVLETAMHAKV